MRISNVTLRNWRNFSEVHVALQNRVFLVGPNASGKSNFLDAFRLLRDIAVPDGGLQRAVAERGGISHLRCLAARRDPNIVLEVELANGDDAAWTYHLAIGADSKRRAVVKKEMARRGTEVLLDRPDGDDNDDPERLQQTHLEQVSANVAYRDIATCLASIRYHHIVPQLVRKPERYVGAGGDPYGGDFLEQVAATPARTRDARLKRIQKALSVAVPQLTALSLERDNRGSPHLQATYSHWRHYSKHQDETDLSDGTLRLLGLLWALLDGQGPLLLEEPELSLHAAVVREIPGLMARLQRQSGRQVIVSSHSSDLLRDEGIAPDEVLLLEPSEEGTRVRTSASLPDIEALLENGLTLADVIVARTAPTRAHQLSLFEGDAL